MECRVLVSSAGRRVQLLQILRDAQRALGIDPWVGALELSTASAAYHLADDRFLVPRVTDPSFVPAVLDVCRRTDVRVIVPTIDTELEVYAAHRAAFEAIGVHVAVSSAETVRIANDKHRTHAFLKTVGVPVPRQARAADVLSGVETVTYPAFAKPAAGSRSVGAQVVGGPDDLRRLAGSADYLVQSIASGVEHTVDAWVDAEGSCRSIVPRRRLEVRSGEVSKGVTVRDRNVERVVRTVVEALPGARGPLCVQVFLDGEDVTVIEINARFGGGFPLAWEAGARMPQWMLEEVLRLPSTATASFRAGLAMFRYDQAVYVQIQQ